MSILNVVPRKSSMCILTVRSICAPHFASTCEHFVFPCTMNGARCYVVSAFVTIVVVREPRDWKTAAVCQFYTTGISTGIATKESFLYDHRYGVIEYRSAD